jgi:hypothetical protein
MLATSVANVCQLPHGSTLAISIAMTSHNGPNNLFDLISLCFKLHRLNLKNLTIRDSKGGSEKNNVLVWPSGEQKESKMLEFAMTRKILASNFCKTNITRFFRVVPLEISNALLK